MTSTQKEIISVIESTIQKHFPNFKLGSEAYTPKAWREREEEYGTESELVIVHDGGDQAPFFSWDYECYGAIEEMMENLKKIGFYAEQCTSWYSAIYKI